jgi:chaperone required for assembly of F1-ATPase
MMNRVASICVRSLVSRKQAVKAINGLFGSKALSRRSTQPKINKSFASRTFFFSTRSKALQQQTQHIEDQSGPDPESETVIQDVTRNNQKVARIGRIKGDRTTERFFKEVTIIEKPSGWEVLLDQHALLTPQGHRVMIPSLELAQIIAAEWEKQHEIIDLGRMPMTNLATTAADLNTSEAQLFIGHIVEVFECDSFCMRDKYATSILGARQIMLHQPWIDWFRKQYDLPINVSSGYNFRQPAETVRALENVLNEMDDWTLTGLHALVTHMHSFVGALGLWHRAFSLDNGIEAALVEQAVSERRDGFVTGEHDLNRAFSNVELTSDTLFLHTLPSPPLNRETFQNAHKAK